MNNRDHILKTALDLFSREGYESVGIQKIVDEAGISKPTLYHYFGSKRGLLDAILADNFEPLIESVSVAAAYNDLPVNLKNIAKVFFSFVEENKVFYRFQLSMFFSSPQSETHQAVDVYNIKLHKLLEDMFVKAAGDHGNMRGRHMRYAFTFMGMINNYIALFLQGYIQLNEPMVEAAVHQFSHGIYS